MNSKYSIVVAASFIKSAKKLVKKFPSLNKDLLNLKQILLQNPTEGAFLGNDCYKVRLKISSKNKGKSGGARVITYVKIINQKIILVTIYDKSEQDNLTEKELSSLLRKIES